MKIYTKTGDDGSTGLIGADRVYKSELRVDCFGTVDELNAALGLAAVAAEGEILGWLRRTQNELFVIGSHLATPDVNLAAIALPPLEESLIGQMEMEIDTAQAEVPPLRAFILPGGTELAARLHLARTICRRAERLVVLLSQDRPVPSILITYLNRLGDWLFVIARLANHRAGVDDVPWQK